MIRKFMCQAVKIVAPSEVIIWIPGELGARKMSVVKRLELDPEREKEFQFDNRIF